MSNNAFIPGRGEVESVVMTSGDGAKTQNIAGQVVTVEIYEDVTSAVMFADFTLADAIGLIELFPILGEEKITIKYRALIPGQKMLEQTFRVVAVVSHDSTSTQNIQTYSLKCVDQEFFISTRKIVQKAYNTTCSSIVSDIIKQYIATDTNLFIETTRGSQDYIVPRLSPFQAIDAVRQRSVSTSFSYSPFVFFRGQQGFAFTSLANLFTKGADVKSRKYTYRNIKVTHDNDNKPFAAFERSPSVEQYNILTFSAPIKTNTVQKMDTGAFGSATARFDLLTKNFTVKEFDSQKASAYKLGLPGAMVTKGFLQEQSSTDNQIRNFHVWDSSRPETFEQEFLSEKKAYIGMLLQDSLIININGDNTIKVGDVIDIELPSPSVTTSSKKDSKTSSGEYLVAKVKHIIVLDSVTSYTTSLHLVKGVNIKK